MKLVEETKAKAMKAYGLILFSLSTDQVRLFIDVPAGNTYDLWQSLLEKYERNTVASKADTLNALYECKMSKTESCIKNQTIGFKTKGYERELLRCSNDECVI